MSDEALRFGDATRDDAQDIVALVESTYRGSSGRQGWTLEAHLVGGRRIDVSAVNGLLASHDTRIILGYRDAELVGCCVLERRATGAYLGLVSVRPHLQRGGVGRALVAEAERQAAQLWAQDGVDIQVLGEDARLVGWYEKQGYVPNGTTVPFAPTNGAIPTRPLNFVMMSKRLTP